MSQHAIRIVIGAALALIVLGSVQAQDSKSTAEATYRDIHQTLGSVPALFQAVP